MTRALPRTDFNSSKLSRVLAGLGLAAAEAPGPACAERLGGWLGAADAMRLYAAHNTSAAGVSITPPAPAELAAAAERLRAALTQAIEKSCTPGAGGTRIKLPQPDPQAPSEIAADYEPYRRFQFAHQREMETAIAPLRARARAALSQATPALAKLAALDAAFGDILAGREARLLAAVPALLEKRFAQLRDAHRQTLAAAGQTDDPAAWLQPGGWLARFCADLQAALLAELDLRLQPVTGLIEAFSNEVSIQQ
jgi:hypothetical protein